MHTHLCLHGHFYQPPREDPWLDAVLPEASAAPAMNWNERITRESYTPLAFARRLDGQGRVMDIVNCYEWMSFNVGPTLMHWLENHAPATYARIVEADRRSVERLGHGNAMAQIHHHVIMPLASSLDKELEVAWGIHDFERRFSRRPDGMWLSEAAVDVPTLEVLAAHGIRYTLLAPRQIRSVAPIDDGEWRDVAEWEVDITRPYLVELPSGRSIAVFFYHGPISQAVAFEGLLRDGEKFWRRLTGDPAPGLRAVGTDGETYGHHFAFGEMALAYVIEQARLGRDDVRLTNFATFLAEHPPVMRARLHEPSSWSCVHGVERWRTDCGCTDGGHPEYDQKWRGPLRQALDMVKKNVDGHYFTRGRECFADPQTALREYGRVLAGSLDQAAFEAAHCKKKCGPAERRLGWTLLAMQAHALSAFASCAWFFDEISRIEPLNALTYALRAMELARETGAPDMERQVMDVLSVARSNRPEFGSGADLWRSQVAVRRETPARLAAQGLLTLWARHALPEPGETASVQWSGLGLTFTADPDGQADSVAPRSGVMIVSERLRVDSPAYRWRMCTDLSFSPLACRFEVEAENGPARNGGDANGVCIPATDLPWGKQQALAVEWARQSERVLWRDSVLAALGGCRMFLPWQEAQTDQPLGNSWMTLLPALCWNYCLGLPRGDAGEEHLADYLGRRAVSHPGTGELTFRLERELARLIADTEDALEGVRDAADVYARARRIGLSPSPWLAENALWSRRGDLPPDAARLAEEAFGFVPGLLDLR